jgi:4-amino-4-deoxy-L-arabinose transferase-like glycosyltransferase
MEGFYDAHVREPVFRLAVRIGLAAAGGSDVGVNLASAAFSTLLLWGTYALGSACFGGGVGFVAALLLAVEPMAIALGADGWRDDAFALFVLLSTLALVRLCEDPSPRRALWAGFAGAAACLTRITSLSFLLPGTAAVVLWGPGSRKARVLSGARALLVCGLLLAPYLATCAVVFGDPFVSINAHTQFYRDRASQGLAPSMSWLGYLATSFRPLELVGNMLLGLTVYPFSNKWLAYDLWIPHCSRVLEVVSLAGLLLFLARPPGRLLLLVLLSTLVPFAFTWRIPGGSEWRFTLVAYPFYLLAAALALDRAATTILRAGARAGAASGPR